MDRDSLLQKYAGQGPDGRHTSPGDEDGVDDAGCYGRLHGIKDRAVMLELRKRNGSIMAVGYAWIDRAEFDPSDGIRLYLGTRTVRITGHNLNGADDSLRGLFNGIARHRVSWIAEAKQHARIDSEAALTVIETIEWS